MIADKLGANSRNEHRGKLIYAFFQLAVLREHALTWTSACYLVIQYDCFWNKAGIN